MNRAASHKPHHPNNDIREGPEPGSPRVDPVKPVTPDEPDDGPAPVISPDDREHDREHDRVIDPAAGLAQPTQRTARQLEVALCP